MEKQVFDYNIDERLDKLLLSQQETSAQMKETDKKFQATMQAIAEEQRKTDKKFQETDKKFQETDKKFQREDKRMKDLRHLFTGHWGKLVESLVRGDLVRLLRDRGILIVKTSQRLEMFYEAESKQVEIDLLAENGDDIVAVEVKTTMKVEDVNIFLEKLRIFKSVFPLYIDKTLFGAIAYINAEEEADKYAYRNGLFVIRATGKSASITNDGKFEPKAF